VIWILYLDLRTPPPSGANLFGPAVPILIVVPAGTSAMAILSVTKGKQTFVVAAEA
jgi:hypothetical protein